MELLQVNLQSGFGGGEVYTCFLGRALRELGQPFDLIALRNARWWREHDTGARRVYEVDSYADITALGFSRPAWLSGITPKQRLAIAA